VVFTLEDLRLVCIGKNKKKKKNEKISNLRLL
jgi:hypothetical protein